MHFTRHITLFFTLFFSVEVMAQTNVADSLHSLLDKTNEPAKRADILSELAWYYFGVHNDSALIFSRAMNHEAVRSGNVKIEGNSYRFMGMAYERLGDYPNALKYQKEALGLYEKIRYKEGIANVNNNISNIYQHLNEYEQALVFQKKALKLCRELDIKPGIAACLGNIGNIYNSLKEPDKALVYYQRSLKIDRQEENLAGAANSLANMGHIYFARNNNAQAEKYFTECYEIRAGLGLSEGMASVLGSLGEISLRENKLAEARTRFENAIDLAKEASAIEVLKQAYTGMYEVNKRSGDLGAALNFHELSAELNDSIFNTSKSDEINKIKTSFALDQQEARNREISEKQKRESEKKQFQLKIIIIAVIGGILLIAVFSYFLFKRFRQSQRQRKIIETQKQEVEEKNKQITDSIRYAKTIQQALMPREDEFCRELGDAFLFFAPRDIVSGDFYWMAPARNNQVLFAIADCTGHGVPGGFMSVLGSSALNEIVNEMHIEEPAEILNHLRERIKNAMGGNENQGKARDGMDISFFKYDKTNGVITYAGANSHIYIIRNDEITVYEGDKMPIGYFLVNNSFKSHTIQLQKGDMVYAFTDGYADQFGGPSGKKFMYRKLMELLKSVARREPVVQRTEVIQAFNQWKGPEEQVDDICLLGFRYT